ncbi:PIG-L family deacetylase [Flaviaesturariibacter amylovorans]|uniref:PIG-L family deacetylase n=1 Tax=Flaviaesturariibacter amylovorans TaxID=1084520 RepID=A0ABP8H110_9BACT
MKKLLFVLGSFLALGAQAQDPVYRTSADIYLGLRKLNVLGSVLYVAAHPDDENTRLLAYLSKDRQYRTGYLSLTRGDGGQNLIGEEQGVELGLIRTQELLAARRIDGGEQFFTRAFDFGFSKTPVETFQKWDREKILADVVWVIRKFQPDVIITRFPTTGEGGHGHHTASAILAGEAFTAAADPKRFPEQLKWVQPWAAKRLLWNTFSFGSNNTIREDQFRFDVGGYNPILGKSYGEIAADSRSQHKSQGFGVPRGRGEALEYFKPIAGDPVRTDLMDGVPLTWERVPGAAPIKAAIDAAIGSFDFTHPEKTVPQLVVIHKALKALPESPWRNQKLKEVQDLVEGASGIWIEAFSPQPSAVRGDSVQIQVVVNNRLGARASLDRVRLEGLDTTLSGQLPVNRNVTIGRKLPVTDAVPLSQPYWLEERKAEGYFNVSDQTQIGAPELNRSYNARLQLTIEGESFEFVKPVRYKFTDPVKGEQYQPLAVLPAATIGIDPDVVLLNDQKTKKEVFMQVQVLAHRSINSRISFGFRPAAGRGGSLPKGPVVLSPGAVTSMSFQISDQDRPYGRQSDIGKASIEGIGPVDLQLHSINYNHIPTIRYFSADSLTVVKADLQTRGKKIGYIVGAGDKVPAALEQMGYDVTLLREKELARFNLKQFDAIISGVRAYNTNEWLNPHHEKLMKYVEDGGNLIVQYNTSNQIGPVKAKIGPFPFNISRNRITDENADVTFLKPQHPVLNFPNKITAADFAGWVQERSIYHASDVDPRFEKILSAADPGEAPDEGSLIIAPHGRGFFTYTGLVFFRELPAGVPGAYRLLANLIALNQKKEL